MPNNYVRRIQFKNYKGLGDYSLNLDRINIMVGPNNCGKSTIIGAFRFLEMVIRRARSKKPELIRVNGNITPAYKIGNENSPISLENVRTNYSDNDATIDFYLSNQGRIEIIFSNEDGCIAIPHPAKKRITSPKSFINEFPTTVYPVPVLGPVEHDEPILLNTTVKSALATHRASRHFRNYWHHFPDGFDAFAKLVTDTWPGMEILPPEKPELLAKNLVMFCRENKIDRELYWAGFGFQVWCQLLSHLSRAATDSTVVIDEPEIYLHPDIQRQLLGVARNLGPQILLATHSVEVMGEADPSEIIVIDKTKSRSTRLRDVSSFQDAIDSIGSIHNVTLAQIARNRRVCFIEGDKDFQLIRRFASIAGHSELASGIGLNPVLSGGFSSWERVEGVGWGIAKALDTDLQLAAIFDRDYYCKEQIENIQSKLGEHLKFVHFHQRKEIENYLLLPHVLQKAIDIELTNRSKRRDEPLQSFNVIQSLEKITDPLKDECQSNYIGARTKFFRSSKKDDATITMEALKDFNLKWINLGTRMEIVPGKSVIKQLRTILQDEVKINLTDVRILQAYKREDLPQDLVDLLSALNTFRAEPYSATS